MCSILSRRDRLFSVFVGALALMLPLAMGCGSKGKISGAVTVDGKPLPAGTITFHPSKGASVLGDITDGHYSVSGVPAGNAKVTVETASIKGQIDSLQTSNQGMAMSMGSRRGALPPEAKKALDEEKKRAKESAQKAKELRAKYRPIPGKYAEPDKSGLNLEVKSGSNTWDVPLSSK